MSEPSRFELAFYVPPRANDLADRLKVLRDLGITRCGTDGMHGWHDAAAVEQAAKVFEQGGVAVHSVHASIGLIDKAGTLDRCLADNRKIIDAAHRWGARSTVWHFRWLRGGPSASDDGNWASAELMTGMDFAEIDRLMTGVLPETCAYAAERGVAITLENMPLLSFANDVEQIFSFLDEMNIENLGFVLDTGHANGNDSDPAALIRAAGDRLMDTHFHDAAGSRGWDFTRTAEHRHVPSRDLHAIPGLGTIDWHSVVQALRDINYPHPIIFENPHVKGHPDLGSLERFRHDTDLTIRMWRAFEDAATYWPEPVND